MRRTVPRRLPCLVAVVALVQAGIAPSAPAAAAQADSAPPPRFEAVSVKPCDPNTDAGGARGGARLSPNRLFIPCLPLRMVISLAFLPDDQRGRGRLVGGPDWLDSERYAIEAVADPPLPRATLTGPMFRDVLVARFGLKVRREMRPVPAYALTNARADALSGLRDGDCVPDQAPRPRRPRKPGCELMKRAASESALTLSRLLERAGQAWVEVRGTDRIYNALPATLDTFAMFLGSILDRPVTNLTGLKGLFDLRLEFSPEGTFPAVDPALLAADPPRAASVFTAVQEQLGLRLEPAQAPAEFVIVESIERLRPN